MNSKKYTITVLLTTLLLLLLTATAIFVIDPSFQYHMPWFGMKPVVRNERYQNAGLARNYNYNAIITGSSMTENFNTSWFDELFGCNTIKLSFSAGRATDYAYLFNNVFKKDNPQYVFYGLDPYSYKSQYGYTTIKMPTYLYDSNPFNDVGYLFNKDIILNVSTAFLYENYTNDLSAIDVSYTYEWYTKFTFSKQTVLEGYKRPIINETKPTDHFLTNAVANLNDILPFIKKSPDTQWYIFLPPYSILEWDMEIRNGTFDATLHIIDYIISELLQYDNVKLFYFQNIEEIITDLDNYKDRSHYGLEINQFMAECMADDKYMMTKKNYDETLQNMKEIALNYNYEALFEE